MITLPLHDVPPLSPPTGWRIPPFVLSTAPTNALVKVSTGSVPGQRNSELNQTSFDEIVEKCKSTSSFHRGVVKFNNVFSTNYTGMFVTTEQLSCNLSTYSMGHEKGYVPYC